MSGESKSKAPSSQSQSQLQSQFGAPSRLWLTKFFLATPEGKAMILFFVLPPVLFVAKLLCSSCLSWTGLLALLIANVAVVYVVARGGSTDAIKSADLKGKNAIVTGANAGMGVETVRVLAERGARVVLACRDAAKGEAARARIAAALPAGATGSVEVRVLDLASKASIRAFADAWGDADLHILVNNAGVMMCPYATTADGFEMQCGTNHLGHMYLTLLLLPTIKRCAARVVTVSSMGHALYAKVPTVSWAKALSPSKAEYDLEVAYGHSKLANLLFTRELEKKLSGSGAHAYTCHPGAVRTELGRHNSGMVAIKDNIGVLLLKTPLQGAQSQLHLALHPNATPVLYHSDCVVAESSPISYSDDSAAELWAESCKLLGVQA